MIKLYVEEMGRSWSMTWEEIFCQWMFTVKEPDSLRV
jgi:hypothetical protein